jgi:hypothetical protein
MGSSGLRRGVGCSTKMIAARAFLILATLNAASAQMPSFVYTDAPSQMNGCALLPRTSGLSYLSPASGYVGNTLSIAMSVKTDMSNMGTVMSFRESVNFKVNGRKINAHLHTTTSGWSSSTGDTIVADGTWHHIVLVYDGTNVWFYADGELDKVWPKSGAIIPSGNVYYGCRNGNGAEQFWGQIKDLAIFNGALSGAQVANLASQAGSGSCPAPLQPELVCRSFSGHL